MTLTPKKEGRDRRSFHRPFRRSRPYHPQLIDTRIDKHRWAQSFEGRASDILSLQDNVASETASHARIAFS